jgi:DnaK suppressor protein
MRTAARTLRSLHRAPCACTNRRSRASALPPNKSHEFRDARYIAPAPGERSLRRRRTRASETAINRIRVGPPAPERSVDRRPLPRYERASRRRLPHACLGRRGGARRRAIRAGPAAAFVKSSDDALTARIHATQRSSRGYRFAREMHQPTRGDRRGAAQGFGKRIADGTVEAIGRLTEIGVGTSLEVGLERTERLAKLDGAAGQPRAVAPRRRSGIRDPTTRPDPAMARRTRCRSHGLPA